MRLLLPIGLGVAAAVATYGTPLFVLGVIAAIVAFWANGVIQNFMPDPRKAPRWAINSAAFAALASVALLLGGVGIHILGAFDGDDAPSARDSDRQTVVSSREADEEIEWGDAEDAVGESATVCGPVRSVLFDSGDTFINVGADFPDPDRFTIVVWNESFRAFDAGDDVCASGRVIDFQGVAQIQTYNPYEDIDFE